MRRLFSLIFLSVIFSLTAQAETMKTVSGSVFYRERIMLPPNAEIKVFLEDVSKMDAPSEVIATKVLSPAGGPPWDFTLEYDPARIDSRHTYALRARIEANGHLMFTNTSHIPAFSGAEGQPVKILLSKVGGSRGGQRSEPPGPLASLTNTYWKPVKLGDQAVTLGAGEKELHMVLVGEENRVRGYSGCNQFMGAFQQNGNQLSFAQMVSTMKACMDGMEQEKRFLDALNQTNRFEIVGNTLSLHDDKDVLIVQFKAVYLY